MSRLIKRVADFFNPRPSEEFQQLMDSSRRTAVVHSRAAIQETNRVRREPVETLYDRIVINPPRHEEKVR